MGTLLKGATLVEFEPATVEVADLRIAQGRVLARGALTPLPGEEVIELNGQWVMPGLVSVHHHLAATLMRGFPRGDGFRGYAQALTALEAALGLDDIQAAATAGGLEGLMSGTTTVFDSHASPNAVSGSLTRVAHALNDVGLRSVLSYRVSDRGGAEARALALDEVAGFTEKARGRFRGAVAVSHLAETGDEVLTAVGALREQVKALVFIDVGEDRTEEAACAERFGSPPLARLAAANLLGPTTVVAQGVHLAWPELSELLSQGTWLVHTPRSNMMTQTGLAPAAKFGVRGCLGTDAMSLDVLAEAQAAWQRSRDSGQPIDALHFLANGHRVASEAFGLTIGPLRENAVADLVITDYRPPTPVDATNLAMHVMLGLSSRHVESVMVDGMWRSWKRKPLSLKPIEVGRAAVEAATATWARAKAAR